jgi:hypothetical protein
MAKEAASIFNKQAQEKLRSPDDLDKYVQVTSPSVWVVLGACVALLAGLLVWGIFGTASTSVSGTGVVEGGQALCLLPAEDVARLHVGDAAYVGGQPLKVAEISSVPLSREEVSQGLDSDYLVASLIDGDWAYRVTFEGDISGLAQGVPLTVSITTERVAPISLILGS